MLLITTLPLVNVLIWVLIAGIIFGLLWWAVDAIGIAQPFNKVFKAILIIAAVIFLINLLISVMGKPF